MELHKEVLENINGIDIIFTALEEDFSLRELLPEETEDRLIEIWNSNDVFCAKLEANYKGLELSSDYLGGCIYNSYNDFYKDDYFLDMRDNVINDARKYLENIREDVSKLTL